MDKKRIKILIEQIESSMTIAQIKNQLGMNTRMGDYRNRLPKHSLAVMLAQRKISQEVK